MNEAKPFRSRATLGRLLTAVAVVALLAVPLLGSAQVQRLAFSGGPDGGTFQFFSNGIATYLSRHMEGVDVSNMASAGSVENLRRVNARDADFGIVYSGDLYLGATGQLTNDTKRYRNVRALSYLYGAPAHLVVRADSDITEVRQLADKRVAVGPAGSGAAASAQRFFESLGLWDKIRPQFIGYNQGASALGDRQIDALWVFAGFPNASVIQAATSNRVRLLQVHAAAQQGTLFDDHPYYTKVTIPAGTYPGVDYDVETIEDGALWVAGRHLAKDLVAQAVATIYSADGLAFMRSVSEAAKAMTIENALNGIVTPVHRGAQGFWVEQGKTLTKDQR
ncbi:TAXI family TRAP transporter solute-binding subunit [Thiococcus pfennigii]|jgi:TRAP transporter TAXI family solute receptor|uniref:TAXI family TRAP transporter solute-binding subunit n=1 Tax=Thiococcus pfennigii TaxID=1057 RepID=UPI00190668E6|nr:TAXI family TRAP transporter solute-binding subunit [Thiococcus pfennigii]MBK1700179.1 C4-dicarboxylate ABC transporter substrate-binding protein [Thiococcus pfennigii]MBK1731722.1 C4-dicarboxylate ABC transporter substrate-binding protein [Thiococcus pfennigii]